MFHAVSTLVSLHGKNHAVCGWKSNIHISHYPTFAYSKWITIAVVAEKSASYVFHKYGHFITIMLIDDCIILASNIMEIACK